MIVARPGVPAGVETGTRFTAADADTVHAAMHQGRASIGAAQPLEDVSRLRNRSWNGRLGMIGHAKP
jgi:hypothetical protein